MQQVHDPAEPTLLASLDAHLGLALVFGPVTLENTEHVPTVQACFARRTIETVMKYPKVLPGGITG
jgi:hypothetical protein